MSRARLVRLGEALALVLVLGAAAALYLRSLHDASTYDEGVYLASLREYQAGEPLGESVFVSQPPGFYWLLDALSSFAGSSLVDLRAAMLVPVLGCLVAAWALGRALAGPAAGVAAAALVAVAPPFPTEALRIQADTASIAFGVAALAATAYAFPSGRRGQLWLAGLAGALLACALLVKLLALPLLAAVAALALRERIPLRVGLAFAGGAAAVVLLAAAAVAGELRAVVDGMVGLHLRVREGGDPWLEENLRAVARFLDPRTPFGLLLVPLGFAVWAARRVRGGVPLGWLWVGAATSALFLVLQRPLLDHHMVLLAVALALPSAVALASAQPSPRWLPAAGAAVLALGLGPGALQELRRLDRNVTPEPDSVAWAAGELSRLTVPDALVVSDLPIVLHYADRRTPPELVDTSYVRFGSDLTAADVLADIRQAHPDAVVVARAFRDQPTLLRALEVDYPESVRAEDGLLIRLRPGRAVPPGAQLAAQGGRSDPTASTPPSSSAGAPAG
jgi:4-amino-4-deoxy-L-arabinose transferase-like glycosyltransferase